MKTIDKKNNKPLITSWLERKLNKYIIDTVNEAVAPLITELARLDTRVHNVEMKTVNGVETETIMKLLQELECRVNNKFYKTKSERVQPNTAQRLHPELPELVNVRRRSGGGWGACFGTNKFGENASVGSKEWSEEKACAVAREIAAAVHWPQHFKSKAGLRSYIESVKSHINFWYTRLN